MGENVYDTRVKDIVSLDTVTLKSEDTIHAALTLMGDNRVSALPVVDRQDRCVGILSATDLVDLTRDVDEDLKQVNLVDPETQQVLIGKLADGLGSERVQTYMSESLTTVSMETPIGKAAKEMLRHGVHHLPVLDHNERLIGIISTMDILSEFADNAPD